MLGGPPKKWLSKMPRCRWVSTCLRVLYCSQALTYIYSIHYFLCLPAATQVYEFFLNLTKWSKVAKTTIQITENRLILANIGNKDHKIQIQCPNWPSRPHSRSKRSKTQLCDNIQNLDVFTKFQIWMFSQISSYLPSQRSPLTQKKTSIFPIGPPQVS